MDRCKLCSTELNENHENIELRIRKAYYVKKFLNSKYNNEMLLDFSDKCCSDCSIKIDDMVSNFIKSFNGLKGINK